MPEQWRYRGQTIDTGQLTFVREFLAAHPGSSRWKLSRQLCETLEWKQPNGALRDVVCRGLPLLLERAGEIVLPPVRRHIQGQCRSARLRPEPLPIDTTPLALPLSDLGGIEIQSVRRTADEPLFHSLMGAVSLLGLSAAGGRTPQVSGVGAQHALSDSALGESTTLGVAHFGEHGGAHFGGLGSPLCASDLSAGDLRRPAAIAGDLLSGGKLEGAGGDHRTWQSRSNSPAEPFKRVPALPLHRRFRERLSEAAR